jgi:hypothetical protein
MSEVGNWIAKVAPMLGAALGGPFGAAAGELVSKALGTKDASLDSIQAAIQAGSLSPDQMVALKVAEDQFALQMEQAGFKNAADLAAIEFQDRDSARKMEEVTHDWTPRILALGITVGFFGLLGFLVKHEVAPASRDLLNIMIGTLGTAWVAVVTYYFGSSSGSKDKDQTIQNLSK